MHEAQTSSAERPRPRLRNVLPLFAAHVMRIPLWQKAILLLAIIAGVLGTIAGLTRSQPAAVQSANHSRIHTPGSGLVDSDGSTQTQSAVTVDDSPAAPWYSRVGISLIIGFILGWLLRTFLRLMAMVAVIAGAVLGGLSHYHLIGSDFSTEARDKYHQASSWVSGEATQIKDEILAHVPSTGGGFLGVFMGLRKKR